MSGEIFINNVSFLPFMTFRQKAGKGLENILKNMAVPAGITALEVPLHESIHSITAVILPDIQSKGVALNSAHWYAKPFEFITFGYMKATEMDANSAGYALISQSDNFLGNLSGAITAALPEVATMTLGMYWINQSITNIRKSGERLGALVKAYCGFTLIAATQAYMKMSNLKPQEGDDYYNFTRSILNLTHLPPSAAAYVTFAGTALMVTGALYLTNMFSKNSEIDPKTGMLK
jgi:hypothetical protein